MRKDDIREKIYTIKIFIKIEGFLFVVRGN